MKRKPAIHDLDDFEIGSLYQLQKPARRTTTDYIILETYKDSVQAAKALGITRKGIRYICDKLIISPKVGKLRYYDPINNVPLVTKPEK